MVAEEFSVRLAQLRMEKGVSARDMSLSIGQNPGYINNIETGKALPSMANFFAICDYLGVTPQEFFTMELPQPARFALFLTDLRRLSPRQFDNIASLVNDLARNK